ncbi:hypothetical protein H0N99_04835 [Candidatus Micrarchaeota archaeon]|nr:hypothetical protein [Candidatus Micrarchaeota archaeon]
MVNPKKVAVKTTALVFEFLSFLSGIILVLSLCAVLVMLIFPSQYFSIFKNYGRQVFLQAGDSCDGMSGSNIFLLPPLDINHLDMNQMEEYCIGWDKIIMFIGSVTFILTVLFEEIIRKRYLKIAQV